MSIIRITVESRLANSSLTIRDLLNSAYFRRYGKPMPERSLAEDVSRWESGENNIHYLYDFVMNTHSDA